MKNTRKMMAFLIGITLLTISPAYADHDRAVTTEQMPRQAQEFIARYFPGEKIAYAKKESDFFEVIYEVMFTNGSKVEFRRNGAWKEVDCRYSSLPAGIGFDADRNQSTGAVSGCCGHQNRTRQAGGRGQVE